MGVSLTTVLGFVPDVACNVSTLLDQELDGVVRVKEGGHYERGSS